MILALIRYYWQVFKYGKPQPSKESNPVYGKEELGQNQHWYGFTALGLVMGLCLSASLMILCSIDRKEVYYPYQCNYRIPDSQHLPHPPHAKGKLALGTTQVSIVEFQIPKPSIVEEGIREDNKVRDPKGDSKEKDWTCEFHLPDTSDLKGALFLSDFDFDVPVPGIPEFEEGEPELICHCPTKFPYELTFIEPKPELKVDEQAVPVNLMEVKRLIGYPEILRDAGVAGKHEIRVQVSAEGRYESHTTEVEMHPLITQLVEKYIDRLVFTPAIRGGKPVSHEVLIPFRFCVIN